MDNLRILTPWNSLNYIILNAFHPLYLFLLPVSGAPTFDLLTLDEMGWKELLLHDEYINILNDYIESINQIILSTHKEIEFSEFWAFFDIKESICAEISDADILIQHTTPVSCEIKPYLFHIESFETLFYPWHISDPFLKNKSNIKLAAIKLFIQNKLENTNCIAVVSHVKKTIEKIKVIFQSDIINSKLFYSPIGIPYIKQLPLKKPESTKRFIFNVSLHATPNNLMARGFLAFLFFAEEWLKIYPSDEFAILS